MDTKLMDTLTKRLNKVEKQLEKVRGCSPLTHGWQTKKYARASRKWDILAENKREIMKQINENSITVNASNVANLEDMTK